MAVAYRPPRPPRLGQIVAQNRPLPLGRPPSAQVGLPRALPGLISYGPQPQGPDFSTRFTGGNVPGGPLSLTHPEMQQPNFVEPQFALRQSAALAPVGALPPMRSIRQPTSPLAPTPPAGPPPV